MTTDKPGTPRLSDGATATAEGCRLVFTRTSRGFARIDFCDHYDTPCSLQKSSFATEDAVWFGVSDTEPTLMASDARRLGIATGGQSNGWVPYPVPSEVLMTTRMHLTREQVAELLPVLRRFVETGEVAPDPKPSADGDR